MPAVRYRRFHWWMFHHCPKQAEARISMPILKEITLAGAALALFLFINASFRGLNENAKHSITTWIGVSSVSPERLLGKDSLTSGVSRIDAAPAAPSVTPGERVRKAFAQFAPDKRKNTI
jgi:hypothetical protein